MFSVDLKGNHKYPLKKEAQGGFSIEFTFQNLVQLPSPPGRLSLLSPTGSFPEPAGVLTPSSANLCFAMLIPLRGISGSPLCLHFFPSVTRP